jgi:hypothetical protein
MGRADGPRSSGERAASQEVLRRAASKAGLEADGAELDAPRVVDCVAVDVDTCAWILPASRARRWTLKDLEHSKESGDEP